MGAAVVFVGGRAGVGFGQLAFGLVACVIDPVAFQVGFVAAGHTAQQVVFRAAELLWGGGLWKRHSPQKLPLSIVAAVLTAPVVGGISFIFATISFGSCLTKSGENEPQCVFSWTGSQIRDSRLKRPAIVCVRSRGGNTALLAAFAAPSE